jgi:hypothetical protein
MRTHLSRTNARPTWQVDRALAAALQVVKMRDDPHVLALDDRGAIGPWT